MQHKIPEGTAKRKGNEKYTWEYKTHTKEGREGEMARSKYRQQTAHTVALENALQLVLADLAT